MGNRRSERWQTVWGAFKEFKCQVGKCRHCAGVQRAGVLICALCKAERHWHASFFRQEQTRTTMEEGNGKREARQERNDAKLDKLSWKEQAEAEGAPLWLLP